MTRSAAAQQISQPVDVEPVAPGDHRRQETVFSTRLPAGMHRRLRYYCFNNDLLIQDVTTALIERWLDVQDAPEPPADWRVR